MNDERRTVDRNERNTEKHSTGVKDQHWAEKMAEAEKRSTDFRATAENWASRTRRAAHTAHSKHSKRCYALFFGLRE